MPETSTTRARFAWHGFEASTVSMVLPHVNLYDHIDFKIFHLKQLFKRSPNGKQKTYRGEYAITNKFNLEKSLNFSSIYGIRNDQNATVACCLPRRTSADQPCCVYPCLLSYTHLQWSTSTRPGRNTAEPRQVIIKNHTNQIYFLQFVDIFAGPTQRQPGKDEGSGGRSWRRWRILWHRGTRISELLSPSPPPRAAAENSRI